MSIEEGGQPKPKNFREGKEKINLRILIAEDNELIGQMLVLLLGMKYSSVELVKSAEEMLARMDEGEFDLVITDNTMLGDMTGIEAIAEIRQGNRLKDIPIILYTTDTGNLENEAKALGAVFLKKPIANEDMVARIEELRKKN